jgi:hypothetical protein
VPRGADDTLEDDAVRVRHRQAFQPVCQLCYLRRDHCASPTPGRQPSFRHRPLHWTLLLHHEQNDIDPTHQTPGVFAQLQWCPGDSLKQACEGTLWAVIGALLGRLLLQGYSFFGFLSHFRVRENRKVGSKLSGAGDGDGYVRVLH